MVTFSHYDEVVTLTGMATGSGTMSLHVIVEYFRIEKKINQAIAVIHMLFIMGIIKVNSGEKCPLTGSGQILVERFGGYPDFGHPTL
jgi:acyl-CoA hydrolase